MLNKLENIIQEVGRQILKFKENNIITKKIINNHTKTNIDLFADKILKKKLTSLKNILIISEESFSSNLNRPEEYFIIDPVDGTLSLINGFKTWVTQVAYVKNNNVICAAIYEPEADNLYSGGLTNGIYLNRKEFNFKKNKPDTITFIDNLPIPNELNKQIMKNFTKTKYLECGSLSLKICKIIYGQANIFIKNVFVHDWDIAPTLPLAQYSKVDIFDINYNHYNLIGNYKKKGLIVCNNVLTDKIKKIEIRVF